MKKLILVCNAHIDPVWQWDWQEGVGVALSTFASAVKLSKEYDALIFNHNESLIYEWVEKYDNKLFQEIVALVKKKKWFIMGGWYIQPDCNIPCGESIIRHILRGREYFREKFNADSDVAVSFDAFGSSRGLVQILKRNAYRGYVACRRIILKTKRRIIYGRVSITAKYYCIMRQTAIVRRWGPSAIKSTTICRICRKANARYCSGAWEITAADLRGQILTI